MFKLRKSRLGPAFSLSLALLLVLVQMVGVVPLLKPAEAATTYTVSPVAATASALPVRITVTASVGSGEPNPFTAGNSTPYLIRPSDGQVAAATISNVTSTATEVAFTVGAGLSSGTYNIRIVSPAGTVNTGKTFTVGNPSIAGASPSSLAYNYDTQQSITVTAQNTNFALGQSVVEVLNSSDQVQNKVGGVSAVASANQLTFTLQTGLISGSYKVRVTTGTEVVTSGLILTVRNTPSISVSPNGVTAGYSNTVVTVTGNNTGFSQATTVNVLDSNGISTGKAGTPTVTSATALSFTLASGLSAGTYTVKAVTGSEEVTAQLTVATPSAVLKYQGINFTQLGAGYSSTYSLTVTGTDTNFALGTTQIALFNPLSGDDTATYVSNTSVSSASSASFTLNTGLAATGQYTVRVTTGQEVVNMTFQLVAPTIQSFGITSAVADDATDTLPAGYAKTNVNVVAANSSFSSSTKVEVVGQANMTSGVNSDKATELSFGLEAGLTAGTYTVRIDVDGSSDTTSDRMEQTITVTSPSIANISPATIINTSSTPVTVTVTGVNTHFSVGTPVVDITGTANESITSISVTNNTSFTFQLTPNSIATPGSYGIQVSTSNTALSETVTAAGVLTVSSAGFSLSPTTIYTDELGTKQITVTGQNTTFQTGTTKVKIDSGEPLTTVTVAPPTSATFTVPTGLGTGSHTVYIDEDNNGTYDFNNTFSVASRGISLSSESAVFTYGAFDMTVTGSGVTFTIDNKPTVKVMQGETEKAAIAAGDITVLSDNTKIRFPFPTGLGSGSYTVQVKWTSGQYASVPTLTSAFTVNNEISSLAIQKAGQDYPSDTVLLNASPFALTAMGNLSAGGTSNKTEASTWSVSGTSVTVSNSAGSKGTITIQGLGTSTVSVTYDGRTDEASITVNNDVSTLNIQKDGQNTTAVTVAHDAASFTLTALGSLVGGGTGDKTSAATWAVVSGSSVSVSNTGGSKGSVTVLTPGQSTIRATYYDKYAEMVVTVSSPPSTGVGGGGYVPPDNNSNTGNTNQEQQPTQPQQPQQPPQPPNEVKVTASATTTTSTQNGQTVATVAIDEAKALADVAKQAKVKSLVIEVTQKSEVINANVSANILTMLASKNAAFEVKSATGSYELPAAEIKVQELAQQLGSAVSQIKVNVVIAKVSSQEEAAIKQEASAKGFSQVATPVEFKVEVTAGNKKVEVTTFGTYVSRTVPLQKQVNANNAVGVVVNDDGSLSPVPTKFLTVNGQQVAEIKRNSNSTYTVVESSKTFADIKGHWAKSTVDILASKMIIGGMTDIAYVPEGKVTRAQFATLIVKALGLQPNAAKAVFKDVKYLDWYAGAVGAAVEAGIIKGFNDGTFKPNAFITKEQAAAMIVNALKVAGVETSISTAETSQQLAAFKDGSKVQNWARSVVAVAAKYGIIKGNTDGTFAPVKDSTRAESAAMIMNLMKKADFI